MESRHTCLLHVRKYRSTVESLVNQLKNIKGVDETLFSASFQALQRRHLCSCHCQPAAPAAAQTVAKTAPTAARAAAVNNGLQQTGQHSSPTCSATSSWSCHGQEARRRPITFCTYPAPPQQLAEALPMAVRCQKRLALAACSSGEDLALRPWIAALPALVEEALAAVNCTRQRNERGKARLASLHAKRRVRLVPVLPLDPRRGRRPRCRRGQAQPQLEPTPRNYAPMRWPPLRVTMEALASGKQLQPQAAANIAEDSTSMPPGPEPEPETAQLIDISDSGTESDVAILFELSDIHEDQMLKSGKQKRRRRGAGVTRSPPQPLPMDGSDRAMRRMLRQEAAQRAQHRAHDARARTSHEGRGRGDFGRRTCKAEMPSTYFGLTDQL